jgi:hypothetical protein
MDPKVAPAVTALRRALKKFGCSRAETSELSLHLTDWVDDLRAFVDFLEAPEKCDDHEIQKRVLALVIHAPYHLNKAADILIEGPLGDEERTTVRPRHRRPSLHGRQGPSQER